MSDDRDRFSARTALAYFFTALEKHPGLIWIGVIEVLIYTLLQISLAGFAMPAAPAASAEWSFADAVLGFLPLIAVSFAVYYVVLVFIEPAWQRTLVRDEAAGLMPLRLSADEGNMARYIAVLFGAGFVLSAFVAGAGFALYSAVGSSAAVFLLPLWFIALLLGLAIMARLLPMSGLIIAQRKFSLLEQLRSTARVFWGCARSLFGLLLISYAILIAIGAMSTPILFRAMQLQMRSAESGLPAAPDGWDVYGVLAEQPVILALYIVVQILMLGLNVLMYGMGRGIAAYAALNIEGRAPQPAREGDDDEDAGAASGADANGGSPA